MRSFLFGAIAGTGIALVAWRIISKKLDQEFQSRATNLLDDASPGLRQEIRRTLDREIPPRVRTEINTTLSSYGVTPQTGRQIATVLDAADRYGLL